MRVVLAEDSVLFREGLVRLLESAGHDVVAAVADATALVATVAELGPDLVIADIRMPPDMDSDGARAAVAIRDQNPAVGVLLLSQHIELRHCLSLIGSPSFGYLLKDRVLHLDDFTDALVRVASGGTALDPEIVKALVQPRLRSGIGALTQREREILGLVAEGRSNASIARRLSLSDRTVEAHMRTIFHKLGLEDDGTTHRRVLAVVTYLESHRPPDAP